MSSSMIPKSSVPPNWKSIASKLPERNLTFRHYPSAIESISYKISRKLEIVKIELNAARDNSERINKLRGLRKSVAEQYSFRAHDSLQLTINKTIAKLQIDYEHLQYEYYNLTGKYWSV